MQQQRPERLKVPVGEAVVVAYRAVLFRPGLVLELGWLPLLVMLAALLLPGLVLRYGPAVPPGLPLADLAPLLEAVVAVLALNAFAVRWHQLMLLGDPNLLPRRVFAWAWVRFIVYTALIYAAGGALLGLFLLSGLDPAAPGPLALAAGIGGAAAGLAVSLAAARLSLLFPAAACGTPLGFAAAWRLMRGNSWRLIGATLLAVVPLLLITGLLLGRLLQAAHLGAPEELMAGPPLGLFLLSGVVEAVLRLLLVALGATIQSDFYRRLLAARRKEEQADE